MQPKRIASSLLLVVCASCALLVALPARAQPSDAQVEKDHRGEGVIKVEVFAQGRLKELNPISGLWEYSCQIAVTSQSTDYPGLREVVRSEVEYVQKGGRWTEVDGGISADRYFEGLANPTTEDMAAFAAKAGWQSLLGYFYNKVVGAVERYELAPGGRFDWPRPTVVVVPIIAEFRWISSGTDVQHLRIALRVKLLREDIAGPWTRVVEITSGTREVLGTEKLTPDEMRRLKTLWAIETERRVKAVTDAVTVPAFASALELAAHTYGLLHRANAAEWEGFIRQVLVKKPGYMIPGSDILLNDRGLERIDKPIKEIIEHRGVFQRQFCPTMQNVATKEPRGGAGVLVTFSDKGGKRLSSITVVTVDGRFMIDDLSVHLATGKASDEVEAITDAEACR